MKVLQVHNFYREPGGEDQVFAGEGKLLERAGDDVIRYSVRNDGIPGNGTLSTALHTFWNPATYRAIRQLIEQHRPAVVHAHNTFPLVSPSLYYAAADERVPVIQTLHNFRLICPAATLYRSGEVCEECVSKSLPYPAVAHGCYRGNRPATATLAAMLSVHRAAATWKRKVSTYIALSEFSRSKFIEGGLPANRIVVKPNFLADDPGAGSGDGGYALFLGRLSEGKGLLTLAEAWKQLPDIPLHIAGDGPLRQTIADARSNLPQVNWLGACQHEQGLELIKRARFLVLPSEWHEQCPMALIEAYACGTPVLASEQGALREVIVAGVSGMHFRPKDPIDLAAKARALWSSPKLSCALRQGARRQYEEKYTADLAYQRLRQIYQEATRKQ